MDKVNSALTNCTLLAYLANMGNMVPVEIPKIPVDFNVIELIDGAGGPTAFARICGFENNPHARGCDMRRRQSINPNHFPKIVAWAQENHTKARPLTHITLESLLRANGKPKLKKRPSGKRWRPKTSLV